MTIQNEDNSKIDIECPHHPLGSLPTEANGNMSQSSASKRVNWDGTYLIRMPYKFCRGFLGGGGEGGRKVGMYLLGLWLEWQRRVWDMQEYPQPRREDWAVPRGDTC